MLAIAEPEPEPKPEPVALAGGGGGGGGGKGGGGGGGKGGMEKMSDKISDKMNSMSGEVLKFLDLKMEKKEKVRIYPTAIVFFQPQIGFCIFPTSNCRFQLIDIVSFTATTTN